MKLPNPQIPNPSLGGLSDPQKLFLLLILFIVGFLVFIGDQVCFQRPTEGLIERIVGYPTSWGYLLFKDRLFAALLAGVTWLLTIGSTITIGFLQWERHWIEPMMAKKAVEQMEREKKWVNKYGKDLF